LCLSKNGREFELSLALEKTKERSVSVETGEIRYFASQAGRWAKCIKHYLLYSLHTIEAD
jgi:hypothetical protein